MILRQLFSILISYDSYLELNDEELSHMNTFFLMLSMKQTFQNQSNNIIKSIRIQMPILISFNFKILRFQNFKILKF